MRIRLWIGIGDSEIFIDDQHQTGKGDQNGIEFLVGMVQGLLSAPAFHELPDLASNRPKHVQ